MHEHEGVIKFELSFQHQDTLPAAAIEAVTEINAWRTVLYRLALIGQRPERYEGLAYGNISCRLRAAGAEAYGPDAFVISGSQTGGIAQATTADYALVTRCDPTANAVSALGPRRPSSECMTHAALYAASSTVGAVMHVHCPEIWRHAAALQIPTTTQSVAYGTPAMAAEIARNWEHCGGSPSGLLAMGGHTDGVVAFGVDADRAGTVLIGALARALQWGETRRL